MNISNDDMRMKLSNAHGTALCPASIIHAAIVKYSAGMISAVELCIVLRCIRDGVYSRWMELIEQVPEIAYYWDNLVLEAEKS